MSLLGTEAYRSETGLPPLVARAVEAAGRHGFAYSCLPEQGRLLRVLAGGATRRIAETGTGYGVGLAWLATGARPGVEVVGVERDGHRARVAAEIFAGTPGVRVLHADWTEVYAHGPYDLLVLDGGGQGKNGEAAADPGRLLTPGGVLIVDDFTPSATWPPEHLGRPDSARVHWLEHPALRAVDLPLSGDLSTVVGVRRP